MGDDRSFLGSPSPDSGRDRRLASVVVLLVVGFVGLAIAKPWGGDATPTEAPPSLAAVRPSVPALPSAPASPSPPAAETSPLPAFAPGPPASAPFVTPVPPPPDAAWVGLHWTRLPADDPLALVTSTLRWRGGFVALGFDESARPLTPLWTSTTGSRWQPLPFDLTTTFWPGTVVLGIAEVPAGLVVLTEAATDCSATSCSVRYVPPVISWTSNDGRTWKPHVVLPTDWLSSSTGSPPLLAAGPAGIVAASSGTSPRFAASDDGVAWQYLPASTLPRGFWLNDLRGTAAGYVALGGIASVDGSPEAVSFWSADGRRWSPTPTVLPVSPGFLPSVGSVAASLVLARDGLIATGRGGATPGATLWWRSPDGRRWTGIAEFAPLGSGTCDRQGCGLHPNGLLAGDGQRILAVRGGPDAVVWISSDGASWRPLASSGDIPGPDVDRLALLPGGVLAGDGRHAWFGAAETR